MKMIKILTLSAALAAPAAVLADTYAIDTKGQHAFISFKISHLGYSWILGTFNDFSGSFEYDEASPADASVEVTVKTDSIDTNHAERDKHLRSADFLSVSEFPEATFTSKSYTPGEEGAGTLTGDLTLHGVTKEISVDVTHIGGGKDPWGGYRQGFEGYAELTLADFGITYNLGPASTTLDLEMSFEGVKQ